LGQLFKHLFLTILKITIMTKIKISFFALAFVLATGAAFATSSKTADGLQPCVTHENPKLNQCPGDDLEPCCQTVSEDIIYFPGN
jgi:hypothetical protein